MELRGGSSILLSIDTCGSCGGIALGLAPDPKIDLKVLVESNSAVRGQYPCPAGVFYRELPGRNFSERLLVSILQLLTDAEVGLHALAGIVIVTGPGSFTGIRIGISAVKGLADGLGIPVVAVSRLELVARQTSGDAIAVLDAGRHEFFVGVYRGNSMIVEVLATREELTQLVRDSASSSEPCLPLLACEDRVAVALADLGVERVMPPTAVDAWHLGAMRFIGGRFDDVASLDANYLRRSETEMLARIAGHRALKAAGRDSSQV